MEDSVPVIELRRVKRTVIIPQEEEKEVFILRRNGDINIQLCSERPGKIGEKVQELSDEQLAVMLIQCGSLGLGVNHILTQALLKEFCRRVDAAEEIVKKTLGSSGA